VSRAHPADSDHVCCGNHAPPAAGITIDDRVVGAGEPVYIVAELSGNHRHDYATAVELIHVAAAAGADAVKLQTYTADTLTIACDRPDFRIGEGTAWAGRTLHDLYSEACTPWDWQPLLMAEARRLGLQLFSTPFDATAVDFLEKMEVPCHKIASFELVDLKLIQRVAATGKPLILSTGMAARGEIDEALAAARDSGATQIALLKCASAYPAPPEAMNLRTLPDLAAHTGCVVGLSDHSLGIAAPVAAVALGAAIIEKHLTLDRAAGGPDAGFSLEPPEFAAMVRAVRETEAALGTVHYGASEKEEASRVFRRSLFVVADVRRGEAFTERNLRSIRPGYGLHPRHLDAVIGCHATGDIARGTPLSWELVERARDERAELPKPAEVAPR